MRRLYAQAVECYLFTSNMKGKDDYNPDSSLTNFGHSPTKYGSSAPSSAKDLISNRQDSPCKDQPLIRNKIRLDPMLNKAQVLNEYTPEQLPPNGESFLAMNGFKLADHNKAIAFFKQQGHYKKVTTRGVTHFEEVACASDNSELLDQFNFLGVYFYFEILKRLIIMLVFSSIIAAVQMYNNYNGTGLASYSVTFSLKGAYFSLGNNDYKTKEQMYLQCSLACAQVLLLIFFYLMWRPSSYSKLQQFLENPLVVQPQRYALMVTGFKNIQSAAILDELFKGYLQRAGYKVYEVQVIYDFHHNFGDYMELERLVEEVSEEKCLIQQGMGSNEKLEKKTHNMNKLEKSILQDNLPLVPLSVIIHFQTLEDRLRYINSCLADHQQNTCSAAFIRCLCCYLPEPHLLFQNNLVLLENQKIGRPDDIYWQNVDTIYWSRLWRTLLSILFIAVCLVITSTVIAICLLYVSGAANCLHYNSSTTLSQALTDETLLYCYCQDNLLSNDQMVKNSCQAVSKTILLTNGLLIMSSVASAITNVLLSVVVEYIVKFMKPITKSSEQNVNFVVILLSTLFNSCFLPLFLNASVFGYTPNTYLHIFNFVNFTNVKNYSDFVPDWYAYVSPYFVNLFLVAIIMPWINLLKVVVINAIRRCWIKRNIDHMLQKQADRNIIQYRFDIAAQSALLILNTTICFIYASSMPVLPLLHLVAIGSLYVTDKICLLKYSRRISVDQDMNNIIIHMIPFIILISAAFSIWALTASTLFPENLFQDIRYKLELLDGSEFRRTFYFLPLTGLLFLVAGFIILDILVFRMFGLCCCQPSVAIHPQKNSNALFSQKTHNANMLKSYKMRNNPDYKHVIEIVQAMLRRGEDLARSRVQHNLDI